MSRPIGLTPGPVWRAEFPDAPFSLAVSFSPVFPDPHHHVGMARHGHVGWHGHVGGACATRADVDHRPAGLHSRSRRRAAVAPVQFQRQMVFYRSSEAPGTIIVHTSERFLYVVQPNGRALRYGIGVGRDGFQWQGLLNITKKAEWPGWTPPPEMIARQPYLPRFMAGGPGNPLGARAMYLGTTVYRIHGTNRPDTIGTKVSSGCFRLVNNDVSDLYDRVPVGTKVIIRQKPEL